MLKNTIKTLCFLVVVGAGLWFMGFKNLFYLDSGTKKSETGEGNVIISKGSEDKDTIDSNKSSSALTLAFKDINLFQAEKNGFTLWRLQATWANMEEIDGIITVQLPVLRYFMENGDVVTVTSQKGDVDQDTKILRFMDDVILTTKTSILKGNLLVYRNDTMTMPDGGEFTGKGMSGSAQSILWQIKNNTVIAEDNVVVVFDASS